LKDKLKRKQKYNIITALKDSSYTVGYLGDGVNDVGALQVADVGISVDSGTDVAKDSSDIILLKKNLSILIDIIVEGRKTFSNTIKFIINTMSSSYGNVLTLGASSLFLKFMPLLPTQILLIDSVSDVQHLTVSTDNVDKDLLSRPRSWDMKFLLRFMLFFGAISIVFDFVLISILMISRVSPEIFRSVWFIESILTEVLATFSVRTKKAFFKSAPSIPVLITSVLSICIALIIPYTIIGKDIFGFTSVNIQSLSMVLGIVIMYFIALEVAKRFFYEKFDS